MCLTVSVSPRLSLGTEHSALVIMQPPGPVPGPVSGSIPSPNSVSGMCLAWLWAAAAGSTHASTVRQF